MYRREAVRRLREHFQIHDDGRPTPYLDEAVEMACDALDRMDQILEKFGTLDRVMAAENVVHCGECARYNAEKHYCNRHCMGKIYCPPEYYCGSGILPTNTLGDDGLFSRDNMISREELLRILGSYKEET